MIGTSKTLSLVILVSLLLALVATTAFAARTADETRTVDPLLTGIQRYSFPDEHNLVYGEGIGMPKATLGLALPSASPGVVLGNTWYDYQRNGSMRRMIASKNGPRVHFVWMRLADSVFALRRCQYKCYNPSNNQYDCDGGVPIPPDEEYAGYCVVDATNDDRGVPGGHNNEQWPVTGGIYMVQAWWDNTPGFCQFWSNCRVPDTLGDDCQADPTGDGFIWPAMCLEETATDTFLHVFARQDQGGSLAYFRALNPQSECLWDHLYCVDTVDDIAEDCDCTDDGMVAIAWTANLPLPGDCDTCSYHGDQRDNDLYVQVSHNSGVDWDPRINVTRNVDGEDGFRPFTDLSVLIDSRDSVHVVWNAGYWPSAADFRCRLFTGLGLVVEVIPLMRLTRYMTPIGLWTSVPLAPGT